LWNTSLSKVVTARAGDRCWTAVGDDEQIRARIGEHVAARRDEGLEDVHHLVGRDVLHRYDLDGERILLGELDFAAWSAG